MPRYVFRGQAPTGEQMQGHLEASSLPEALVSLRQQGPAAVQEVRAEREPLAYTVRLREPQAALLYQQLASGVASGLPLPEAVRVIANESPHRQIRALMHLVWEDLQAGLNLSEAMARFPRAFPPLHRTVIAAGEEANALDITLRQLATHTDTTCRAARGLAQALTYPAAIGLFGLGIITFLVTFIVPKFVAMFQDLGVKDMPYATQVILLISKLWLPSLFWLVVVVVLTYLLAFYQNVRSGSITADRWKLRMPVLGAFFFHLSQARLVGVLAMLVERGVSLPRAVRAAAGAAGNRTVEAGWRRAANLVEEGVPLAEALEQCGGAPEVLSSRIAVGEASGTLPDALRETADYYTQRAESAGRQVGPMLEPLFIIIAGVCVAFIAIGMFMPLLAVISSLSGGEG